MRSRFAAACAPFRLRAGLRDGTVTAFGVLMLLGGLAVPAMAQDKLWMTQLGTASEDSAYALAPDGVGGVMVAGSTDGSLAGANAGGRDAYVARYDADGNQLWIRQFGTSGNDRVYALTPTGVGGVMVAGYTYGSLGSPNAGNSDAFVARYDADGTQLWIRQFGTNGRDIAFALASDGAGGVMVAGYIKGQLFNSIPGGYDAFVARYDADGTQLWFREFGTTGDEFVFALAPDGADGVMVAVTTEGGRGGVYKIRMVRYDASGAQLWIKPLGTSAADLAFALSPDGAGGVFVAGQTRGSLGGANAGNYDAFVARYDTDGTQLWIRQFGTAGYDRASALAPDGTGGVVVAGHTYGSLGGPSAGDVDAFIARYDANGNEFWVRQFGTMGSDFAKALASDGTGGMMVAGITDGGLGGANAGVDDGYVARFVPCYADLDASTGLGTLDIFDFLAFQNAFVMGELVACDCDTSTGWLVCDIFDFLCFQDAFVTGCP